jgi:hypothetical protein
MSDKRNAGIGRSTNLVFEKGQGSYVYVAPESASFQDVPEPQLKKFLDLTCGIGVFFAAPQWELNSCRCCKPGVRCPRNFSTG